MKIRYYQVEYYSTSILVYGCACVPLCVCDDEGRRSGVMKKERGGREGGGGGGGGENRREGAFTCILQFV